MAFQISFDRWLNDSGSSNRTSDRVWPHIPRLEVVQDGVHLFSVTVRLPLVACYYALEARHKGYLAHESGQERLSQALVRWGIWRIEEVLREDALPEISPDTKLWPLVIEKTDLTFIETLIEDKTCIYQLRDGRDLFCSAASEWDKTIVIGHRGLHALARTSRPFCRTCNLPDTDYVCSHLLHPQIADRTAATRDRANIRSLASALCDLDRSEIAQPHRCHAGGGHSCWERIVQPEVHTPIVPLSPQALPEALDFFDTVWRLAFGKRQVLFRYPGAAGPAALATPCVTRPEFESHISALADILKSMEIPDELFHPLPEGTRDIPKDQTLERLRACLKKHLEETDYQSCRRAVDVLRDVNTVRRALQHAATRELISALAKLNIPNSPPNWSEAWDHIRVKTIEALTVIREQLRIFSLGRATP